MSIRKKMSFPSKERYEKEFERLHEAYHEDVYKFIVRNIYDPIAAEDLTQNTFLALYMNLEDVLEKENVRAWLYKTALNKIDHYHRGWLRKEKNEVELKESIDLPAPPYETVEEFLSSLPNSLEDRDKEILTLYFYYRYNLNEIAKRFGMTHGSMRVHMTRLLGRLRDAGIDWLS